MNYQSATDSQLLTIAYHEHCTPVDRVLALQELDKRKKLKHNSAQSRIVRKIG